MSAQKSPMRRNVIWNIVEVATSALVLFLTYRVIIHKLGVEALGLWSLVGAVVAMSRFADVGVSAGLPARLGTSVRDGSSSNELVATAFVMNVITYSLLGLGVWLIGGFCIDLTRNAHSADARSLLAYSSLAFALTGINGTFTFALIGVHRSDIKSIITVLGSGVQLVVTLGLVSRLGLPGLALGQISQSAFCIIAGGLALNRVLSTREDFRPGSRFNLTMARTLFSFGAKVQALNLAGFLFEPLTKFAIGYIGGLQFLGLYELASRVAGQARQVVVVPAANLLAVFATGERSKRSCAAYEKAVVITSSFGTAIIGGVSVASPLISFLWLGSVNLTFVLISLSLSIGWIANISAVPAYYLGIANHQIRWNVIGALATALISPAAIMALSFMGGAASVGLGPSAALLAGAALTHLNFRILFGNEKLAGRRLVQRLQILARRLRSTVSRAILGSGLKPRPSPRFTSP